MRILYLVMGIVVILALVSSPALAISKSEIITSYQDPNMPTKGSVPARQCGNCSPKPTSYPSVEDAKEQQRYYRDVYPANPGDYFIILSPDHDDTSTLTPHIHSGLPNPVDTTGWTTWTFPDLILEKPRSRIHYPIIFVDTTAMSGWNGM